MSGCNALRQTLDTVVDQKIEIRELRAQVLELQMALDDAEHAVDEMRHIDQPQRIGMLLGEELLVRSHVSQELRDQMTQTLTFTFNLR